MAKGQSEWIAKSYAIPPDEAQVEQASTHQDQCTRLEKILYELDDLLDETWQGIDRDEFASDDSGYVETIGRCLILAEALRHRIRQATARLGHE